MKLTRFVAQRLGVGVLALSAIVGTAQAQAPAVGAKSTPAKPVAAKPVAAKPAEAKPAVAKPGEAFTTGSSDAIIQFINQQIREGWENNEVQPSPVSEDTEWLRRVYLDIVGHIPDAEAVEEFLTSKDKAKRSKVIEKLLDNDGYVRNFTTVWTNLSIGRQTPQRVSRAGMQKFYREAFAKNRPWNEVVTDIVTAEGHYEENGAVNYLLAQMTMPDDMVQATAKTARLFLGLQVQCTQCHNHPFNDWQQTQFWEFNGFFRQMGKVDHRKYDPKTGRQVDDYSEVVFRNFEGPVYFEKRNGLMQVAYPKYFEKQVDESGSTERRKEFGKLISEGDKPYVAMSMVNRMWAHFFGYAFTKPVDDMGPHNQASHPALHDRLGEEFVKSRYDVKQLIRWICNSEAYNLTSQLSPKNATDNPAAGETPLFSHAYVKSMEAEQLYDSLIIATNAHRSGRSSWEQAEKQRQVWLRQFVMTFGTDENDESTTFNGTIPQALALMNGEVIRDAVKTDKGSHLREVLEGTDTEQVKIKKLYMATLTRAPSVVEVKKAQELLKVNKDKIAAFQDLFWALLNSNEFIFIH